MATLAELHRELFPAAVPVAPLEPGQGERVVGWVRVLKARVPAFDALEPDDLALVPSSALAIVAGGEPEVVALAEALLRAHVSGVLVLDGGGGGGAAGMRGAAASPAGALGAALAGHGVASFLVDGGDAASLERSIIGYLVNSRAEFERQASLLEAQLARLALQSSDLAALVAAIGTFLERAVALEGRRGDTLAAQAPAAVPDAAVAAATYLARPRAARLRAAALRVPLPAAADGTASPGALVLLGERPPSELERVVAERIAGLLALEIARTDSVRRARDEARRAEVLPGAGPPWVVVVARQVVPDLPVELAEREETRRELRRLAPLRRMALRGDATSLELRLVLAADPEDPGGLGLAGRVAGFLGRGVAVSRPFGDPVDRAAAEADARATLDAAETLRTPPRGRPGRTAAGLSAAGQPAQPARRSAAGPGPARAPVRRLVGDGRRAPGHAPCPPRPARHRRGGRRARGPPQHGGLSGAADRGHDRLAARRPRPAVRARARASSCARRTILMGVLAGSDRNLPAILRASLRRRVSIGASSTSRVAPSPRPGRPGTDRRNYRW